jgi:hypothetical protein
MIMMRRTTCGSTLRGGGLWVPLLVGTLGARSPAGSNCYRLEVGQPVQVWVFQNLLLSRLQWHVVTLAVLLVEEVCGYLSWSTVWMRAVQQPATATSLHNPCLPMRTHLVSWVRIPRQHPPNHCCALPPSGSASATAFAFEYTPPATQPATPTHAVSCVHHTLQLQQKLVRGARFAVWLLSGQRYRCLCRANVK